MLTKSDYLRYRECPIHCWLHKHRPEALASSEDVEQRKWRSEQGDLLESQARRLFPDGQAVSGHSRSAVDQTRALLAAGATTLFQATAIADGHWAMADILRFDASTNSWELYEVKSASRVDEKHLHDVCFQRMVFRRAGFRIGACFVVHVNTTYVRRGELDPRGFLTATNVTAEADALEGAVEQGAVRAAATLALPDVPAAASCTCTPKNCSCVEYCFPDLPKHSVFSLPRFGKARHLYNSGFRRLSDLPGDIKLSERQRRLVAVVCSGRPHVDKPGIRRLLDGLSYPLHFLDYETLNPALPMYDGYSPYQHMTFQYSLHVMHEPSGEPEHKDCLATGPGDPGEHIVRRLVADLHPRGTVVVWNKSFEMTRNKELAVRFPEFAELLHDVNARIFDLMEVFRRQHFVHPEIGGSDSIKKVLPVLVPGLSYGDLKVQDGATASVAWHRNVHRVDDDVAAAGVWDDLRAYCRLDTLAMVEVFRYLHREVCVDNAGR